MWKIDDIFNPQTSISINVIIPKKTDITPEQTTNIVEDSNLDKQIPDTKPIPEWVRGVFAFWADGKISDQELIDAIKFLVESKVIILN